MQIFNFDGEGNVSAKKSISSNETYHLKKYQLKEVSAKKVSAKKVLAKRVSAKKYQLTRIPKRQLRRADCRT